MALTAEERGKLVELARSHAAWYRGRAAGVIQPSLRPTPMADLLDGLAEAVEQGDAALRRIVEVTGRAAAPD